jgi:hypothetical protein
MAAIFAFRCSCCGELHEGSPSIGFDAPLHYAELDADERAAQAQLGDDLCTIDHTDRRDHFVRVCLEVWVSLSAENFARYRETWDAPDTADRYFGWFCNRLPGYPDTLNLKTLVHPRGEGLRPWIELEPGEHPLAIDQHQGLSMSRAQALAELVLHQGGNDDPAPG